MRILITGANGFLGRALASRFADQEPFSPGHAELDITDEAAVEQYFARHAPELVLNCAVLGVDTCEREPRRASRVNVDGPALLARACARANATLVHFSTNYVFSGDRTDGGLYTPDDEARPINVYGATKLEGERVASALCPRTFILRTSWVFGERNEGFVATLPRKLRNGESVRAFTDIFASGTYISDLVERVGEIIATDDYGVYHVNNSGVCSYAEFAEHVADRLELSAAQRDSQIELVSSNDAQRAPRPRWSPMYCTHSERLGLAPLRSWREALDDFIASDNSLRVAAR